MDELWKDIPGYPGYQASTLGRIRSFWRKKHQEKGYGTYRALSDVPRVLPTSDDGNGYQKLMIRNYKNEAKCKKVHRLIAETFLEHDDDQDTVDHIKPGPEGKLDNSITNLRWISRRENIQKAYKDGVNNDRIRNSRKPIVVYDLWEDIFIYFDSIKDAAERLRIPHRSISGSVDRYAPLKGRYVVEQAGREDKLLYGDNEEYQCFSRVQIC